MELLELIDDTFELKTQEPNEIAPLMLAYIGDTVFDMVIRTIETSKGNKPMAQVHRDSTALVNAGTQAKMADFLEPMLTPEELSFYKRGRNAKSQSKAKNASIGDYRKATGFEALMGYLYFKKRNERIVELVKAGLDGIKEGEKK